MAEPKDLLPAFEKAIEMATLPPGLLADTKKYLEARIAAEANGTAPSLKDPEVRKEYFEASDVAHRAIVKVKNAHLVANFGHELFLAIIQKLVLPAPLRKKVEMASRAYLKTTKPRYKAKSGSLLYLEYITTYEKYLATLHAHLAVAKQAIAQGKAHAEEGEGATKRKVGPFTLINTGGFSKEQMDEVEEVVKKATAFAKSSGLGEVCYGDIQVTNTIHKSNILAFYLIAKDEMFIRANVKASIDTIQTVLHELGHRYEHKFLKNASATVSRLYRTLDGQETKKQYSQPTKKPTPGDSIVLKGEKLVVTDTSYGAGGRYKVILRLEDDPKAKFTMPLDAFWKAKGEDPRNFDEDPNYIGFVTNYAKSGGPSENFAEMFSFYCLGRLPVLQSVPFEEAVFGTGKTADERVAQRVIGRLR